MFKQYKAYQQATFILGVLLLACTSLVAAQEQIDKTIDVDKNSLIEIKHISGKATIKGWSNSQVRVVGELGEQTEEFRFERDGKSVIIEVEVERNNANWGWGNNSDSKDKLTIYVPHTSKVNYHSPNADLSISEVYDSTEIDLINGDLKATDLKGSIRLKTVNGDIRTTDLQGEVVLDSVNGDINAQQIKGEEIYINTVNGDINGFTSASEVNANTVNGDIKMTLKDVKELKTNTVNGDVEMDLNLIEDGTVRASSVGGRIELGFQLNVQAKFSLEAHAGGSIKNTLTADKAQKAKYGPRKWLEFSTGKPNAWVDVSTVNGRIETRERNK